MTVEHLEDEKLQRYFDGETSPGESTVVRHHLDACGVCTSRLQKLEKLRGLFTEMVEDVGETPAFDAMFANIRTGIEKQKNAGFGERFRLFAGDAVTYHRRTVVSAAAVTLAAAAALVLMWSGSDSNIPTDEMPSGIRGTQVEEVQFGQDGAGTVFQIENGDGSSAAVIWINDDE
ncbi:MAG: zf-HC2 domain-containing protein [Sandaracinaceae bacterium]|nr:zf-HC2 domain-containing protein [Sandaracinaceae bacterium]